MIKIFQKGFSMTLAFFGIIAIILFIVAFKNLREVNVEKLKTIPIKDSVKAIKGNWSWILIVTANLIFWIAITIRQSTVVYYCQYYLGDKDLTAVINGVTVAQVIGMVCIPFLVKVFNKYGTMIFGFILVAFGHIAIFFCGSNIQILIALWVIACIGQGIACSMPFAMLSDTVDYGEWKTGIRASGFLTAIGSAFCIKAGSGIGGFIPAIVMEFFGYVPNAVQSAQAVFGIQLVFTWLLAVIFLCGILPMIVYRKYERNERNILMELAKRN